MEARVAMKTPLAYARTRHVGIALSADRLVAFLSRRQIGAEAAQIWSRPLTPSPAADTGTNLGEALGALRNVTGGGTLHVALMPPLASFRRLDLTGVNEVEAKRIVQRDPSRFLFLPCRSGVAIDLWGNGWRRTSPFTLIAAPSSVLEALGAATRASGWSLGAVIPASLAWASPTEHRRSHDCVACLGTHIEVVLTARGTPTALRRIPCPPGALKPSHVLALLAERGITVQPDATVMLSSDEAMAVAAERAASFAGPIVLPERERRAVRQREQRGTRFRFVASVFLLALTAGLEFWDVARERASVAAERRRIQRPVIEAVAVRESVSVLNERLAAIRSLESSASYWSSWLASLAAKLPSDAFLVSLSAGGDSLRLEGAATRATPVFEALTGVPGVRSLRSDGPIRQEVRGGDATSEHFLIAALLDRSGMSNSGTDRAVPPNVPLGAAPGRAP